MSQGTFSDTPILMEAFKRIFLFPPKIDIFLRGESMLNFWPKMAKFSSWHFLLLDFPRELGVSKNSPAWNHF